MMGVRWPFLLLLVACEIDHQHPSIDREPLPQNALVVCAAGATVKGVDVSHWDGTVDWKQIADAGQEFGIAKATEGVTFKDPMFQTNWAAINSAKMVRGAYHFVRPTLSGTAQARFFLSTVGTLSPGDLPPVLDWELRDSGVPTATEVGRAQDFIDEVKAETGLTTIIYSSRSFLSTVGNPAQFAAVPLWDAYWNVTCPNIPDAWATWTFWQTGGLNGMPGTATTIDVNLFNGTRAQLDAITVPVPAIDAGTPDAGDDDAGPFPVDDAGPPDDAGAGLPDAGAGADGGSVTSAAVLGCGSAPAAWTVLLPLLLFCARRRLTLRRS